ncbi:hypothetical protein OJF2_61810 [Aquisphaera giovannonii]|uniref:DUF4136 domain-containing protein n=1 Tax=Aquisphaera giovannonii TaxID=406548 RepID=A0A5B9WCI2_9BACT|nr:DUF6655 family protein [Aquisphaera giovannonii]QEH37590.1 hypothetical protein OJF2_61810 [Aquisphaera giovannonii]
MATILDRRGGPRAAAMLPVLAISLAAAAGCGTVKTSGTSRTGTEQLLLTNAWDTALAKVDFSPLTGVPVYLDTTNVSAVDQGWVVSSLRQALLTQGVLLRPKAEQAQWVVEARVGAFGTDSYSAMVGVPQTTIPQTISGMPSGTIPEMSLYKKSHQEGVAKLALFAYDRSSGQLVWTSGTSLATSSATDRYVAGVGPIQGGTIRGGTKFIGTKIPVPYDTLNAAAPILGKSKGAEKDKAKPQESDDSSTLPFTPAPARPAAMAGDREQFAPAD